MATSIISERNSCKIANMGLLCSFFVVCTHVPWSQNSGWFYCLVRGLLGGLGIAVPFFFVVSGFMVGRHMDEVGWWRSAVCKRIHTLLVPYLIWCLVATLLASCFLGFDYSLSRLIRIFGLWPLAEPEIGPLWYVRNLMGLVVLSPVLVYLLSRWPKLLILFGVVDGIVYPTYYIFDGTMYGGVLNFLTLGWGSLHAIFFFSFGLWLSMTSFRFNVGWMCSLVMLVSGVAVCVFRAISGGWAILMPIQTMALLVGLWWIIPSRRYSNAVTSLAFPVYILHWFFLFAYRAGRIHLPSWMDSKESALAFALVSVMTFVLSAGVAIMLKKFVPKMSQIVFGGRV